VKLALLLCLGLSVPTHARSAISSDVGAGEHAADAAAERQASRGGKLPRFTAGDVSNREIARTLHGTSVGEAVSTALRNALASTSSANAELQRNQSGLAGEASAAAASSHINNEQIGSQMRQDAMNVPSTQMAHKPPAPSLRGSQANPIAPPPKNGRLDASKTGAHSTQPETKQQCGMLDGREVGRGRHYECWTVSR
jgi:hypothetical protein